MINWCVFAMIILKGYGWSPKDLILGIIEKNNYKENTNGKYIENVSQEAIMNINDLSLNISQKSENIYKKNIQQDNIIINSKNVEDALAELSTKIIQSSNTILINKDNILSQLNEFKLHDCLYKKASIFTEEELLKMNYSINNEYAEEEFKDMISKFMYKTNELEKNGQILYINYKKI